MPSEAASASLGGFEQLVDEPEVGEPPAAADNALAEESDSDFEQRGGFFCRTFVDAETERRFDAHQFRQALVLQLLQGAIIQFGPTVCFAGLHFFRPSAHHAATFEAEWRERGGWGALALDSSFFGIRLAVHAMRDHQLAQRICSSIWCICFPLRVLYATFIERASSTAQHTGGSTLVSEESGVIEVWLVVFAQYFCIGIVHGSLGTPPLYRWPVALLLALLLWYDTGFEASWGQAQETRAWLAAAMVAACILMQALEIKQRDDFGLEAAMRRRIEQLSCEKERMAWDYLRLRQLAPSANGGATAPSGAGAGAPAARTITLGQMPGGAETDASCSEGRPLGALWPSAPSGASSSNYTNKIGGDCASSTGTP